MTEYTKLQTAWWMMKRFLRTFVPQVPAIIALLTELVPVSYVPYFVLGGAFLTVLDKFFRDVGAYDAVNPLKSKA